MKAHYWIILALPVFALLASAAATTSANQERERASDSARTAPSGEADELVPVDEPEEFPDGPSDNACWNRAKTTCFHADSYVCCYSWSGGSSPSCSFSCASDDGGCASCGVAQPD